MDKLSPQKVLELNNLKPKKSFGQNFMMNQNINAKIAQEVLNLNPQKKLTVVEFGAGTGSLTKHLLTTTHTLYAVERDRDLVPLLKNTFEDAIKNNNLKILEEDAKQFDLQAIFATEHPGILVGNLPYHLTSSFMLMAIKNNEIIKGAVFLIQKEVGTRLSALANNKDYGFLSVVLQLAFDVSIAFDVSKTCFWPVPKVESCVLTLSRKANFNNNIKDLDKFIDFVKVVFQQRRKKISTILGKKIDLNILKTYVNPSSRPENLSPQDFINLYTAFNK
jgi:16S rRNA (adenine1518-N6/adenine1519-N6)-dimethyltransferase